MSLHKKGIITAEDMAILIDSAKTLSKAVEIGREPASIGLPPGMAQVGKGLLGSLMGNPMAMGGLTTGLITLIGACGLARNERKKRVAMNREARDLRDAEPDEAAKKWERSELFKS